MVKGAHNMKLERKYGKPMLWAVILFGVYLFFFDLFFAFKIKKLSAVYNFEQSLLYGRGFMRYYTSFIIVYFVMLFSLTLWSRQRKFYVILLILLFFAFLNWTFYMIFSNSLGDDSL